MFLDIGLGILSAIYISLIFDVKITLILLLVSVVFSLGPDFDFVYFFSKRDDTKYDHKHRDFIHYPLLYLPIGSLLLYLIFGKVWAVLFFLASLLHFIHDSIGIGWGIKWLYPFSENNYAFFYLFSKKLRKGLRKPLLVFNEKELPAIVAEHGDKDWVKNIYYKWHPIAIVEFIVFIISLIVLYIYV